MTSHPPSDKPAVTRSLRRDAERNRQRIVKAAQEVFAEEGLGAGLNDIAHRANVGVGTVYRRFPDKEALIAAALEDQIALMLEVAEAAMRQESAWEGLMLLLDQGLGLQAANIGLRDVTHSSRTDHPDDALKARFIPYVQRLLAQAQDEGSVRPGVTVEDVIMIQVILSELARNCLDSRPDAWRRYLYIMVDGLRNHDDASALPPPLDAQTAAQITRQWISAS